MNRSNLGLKFKLSAALIAALSLTAVANAAGSAPSGDFVSTQNIVAGYASVDSKCQPPSSSAACAEWHKEIRQSFAPREIGLLFGAATSYPEYRSSYARVKAHYERLRNEAAAQASR